MSSCGCHAIQSFLTDYVLIGKVLVTILALYVVSKFVFAPKIRQRAPRPIGVSPSSRGTGKPIPCTNPATGEKSGNETINSLTVGDVEACVSAARKAQQEWVDTTFAERALVLADLRAAVLAYEKDITDATMCDTGKTREEAEFGEILTSCEKLRWLERNSEGILKAQPRKVPLLLGSKSARLEYLPMGVIGIIIPWNYPFHSIVSAAAAAIMAGNAALVKVSEWSTYSKILFEKIIREVLAKRGHNPDLIQVLPGFGETGEALVRSKGVDKILFIGSPNTGKRVMHAAADNLTPVILELGGKDPMVIFDDVNLNWALPIVMRGCFINLGQNCISSERVFVHESIYDKFANMLADKVKETNQGQPTKGVHCDFGSMTMPGQVTIVETLVNDAVKRGAKVLAGGKRNPKYPQGNYFEPTVLAHVPSDSRILFEETFGPVALLVPFSTEDDLVQKVNGTCYGLGASILCGNAKRGERIGLRFETGMLTVNDYGVSYLIQSLPFGGCKHSGFGRFNGPEGLRGFAREVSVVSDRFGVKTPIPRLITYPIPKNGAEIISSAIHFIYEQGLSNRLKWTGRFLSNLVKNPKLFTAVQ
eukprot:TRINITY_DN464_c0_g2_i1.p1 TRINITY_DN464_c0_g2~~TRINITY_DN464_c0_g2_i1.p1  ORF type:complete len:591 (+),score=118.72 TRINITY_DN464_c0_g2_i1:132-1904(+)